MDGRPSNAQVIGNEATEAARASHGLGGNPLVIRNAQRPTSAPDRMDTGAQTLTQLQQGSARDKPPAPGRIAPPQFAPHEPRSGVHQPASRTDPIEPDWVTTLNPRSTTRNPHATAH